MNRLLGSGFFWLALCVAVMLAGIGLTLRYWGWLHPQGSTTVSNSETLRNVGLLLGGALAFVFAGWRAWVAERQASTAHIQADTSRLQADIAQRRLLNERYERGAEMLGSDVLSVRLGGIYTLRRLAEENPEQYYVQVMELLCAFVRNPTGKERGANPQNFDDDLEEMVPVTREDVEAVMNTIGRRSEAELQYELAGNFRLDLHGSDLGGISIENMKWCKLNLRGANLSYAKLNQVDLSDSDLEAVRMDRSRLRGVNLRRTNLRYANLFDTSAIYADFTLSDLRDARMIYMRLVNTILVGADLRNSELRQTDFGTADLFSAKLEGAHLDEALFGRTQEMSFSRNSEPILKFARLTQSQLDEAKAHPDYPPTIAEGTVDIETGEPLVWRGKPLDDGG